MSLDSNMNTKAGGLAGECAPSLEQKKNRSKKDTTY